MHTRRFVAAVVGIASLVAFAPDVAAAPEPSVRGAGIVTLPSWFGDVAGDRVVFGLNARGTGQAATGTFNVVHLDDAGGLYAHANGEVTCVSVADGMAVTTGIIRRAWFRDFPGWDVTGTAAAITVADGGSNDVLGFDFEFFPSSITPCCKVEPFAPVEQGNFTVR
jgi:hypothetical protein